MHLHESQGVLTIATTTNTSATNNSSQSSNLARDGRARSFAADDHLNAQDALQQVVRPVEVLAIRTAGWADTVTDV